VSYQIRDSDAAATPRWFGTLHEVYAYAAGAIDLMDDELVRFTVGPWAVWRVGDGPEEEVLPAGELLARAVHWRDG
jgi:hypothetical protein